MFIYFCSQTVIDDHIQFQQIVCNIKQLFILKLDFSMCDFKAQFIFQLQIFLFTLFYLDYKNERLI